ncbi:MAG: PTS sugar transporter subunit IIA [Desulfuromonadales bacterium]|nr:PTS sugar transporter subunit IIA [Desulfuromonadales bacterium]
MKISELLDPAAIVAELKGTGKKEVLIELTDALLKADPSLVKDDVLKVLMERERLGSTGIGDGVAIPHGKLKEIDRLLISFGLSHHGVDFDSMDGKPAHLFFLLVAPEESVGVHLKTLARISKLLKSAAVRERLQSAVDSAEIYRIIIEEEEQL